jgi:hypothetical protein
VEDVRLDDLGPQAVNEIGLLDAEVHERDGKGRAVPLGRLADDRGQPLAVEPHRLRVGALVEDQVGPDRRAQAGGGEREEVVRWQTARAARDGHAR